MTQKIIIGKFGKTFSVYGWIKIHSFTEPATNIVNFKPWFISIDEIKWQEIPEYKWQQKGQTIIVQLPNITSPEQAKIYTNQLIAIERTQLPKTQPNEYYWTDLIGTKVVNTQGEELGVVDYLFATVSNDVIVVKNKQREHLIPFLKDIVLEIDLKTKKIIVDWED